MKRIAILASGSGTNAQRIIEYFSSNAQSEVHVVLTNNPMAGVIDRAKKFQIKCHVFPNREFKTGIPVLQLLLDERIDLVVLAGFLLLIPEVILDQFSGRIINIHPALLPGHGGKGFFGESVHKAVIASGSIMSGITIHHVNKNFDEGEIIFQAACHVDQNETSQTLAEKIHALEHEYYPVVIKKVLQQLGN